MALLSTQYLILRRTPYRESDWIVCGLSPDVGKLSLVLPGARKAGDGKCPEADIFREFEAEYSISDGSELGTARNLELIADASNIAEDPDAFQFAGALAAFALANSAPDLAAPLSYDVLRNILLNFAEAPGKRIWTREEASALFKITWLTEAGLLDGGSRREFLESVIDAGIGAEALPEVREGYWREMAAYLNDCIRRSGLRWK